MMYRSLLAILSIVFYAAASLAADAPARTKPVAFHRDIQPILVRSCLSCHDARKERGGLRLDRAEAALRGGDSGSVIKPGDAANSRLVILVSGLDPHLKMPPNGKPSLTTNEVGLLRAWIDQAANWPTAQAIVQLAAKSDHWAFQPVKRPALPAVKNRAWPQNEIDAFVLSRLEKERITPAPRLIA